MVEVELPASLSALLRELGSAPHRHQVGPELLALAPADGRGWRRPPPRYERHAGARLLPVGPELWGDPTTSPDLVEACERWVCEATDTERLLEPASGSAAS